jgi:hypothetical protein
LATVPLVAPPFEVALGSPENTACPTAEAVGLRLGDILSCVAREPESGPAAGIPGGLDPEKFRPTPGEDSSGLYGPEPKPLPMPDHCDTPVSGTWTQDQGAVTAVSHKGGRTIFTVTLNVHWTSGMGEGGRSTFVGDVWPTRDGYRAYVAREMFEGTIGGRTGSMVAWNVGIFEPNGRYVGEAFSIGGTEGLTGVRFDSNYTGFANKGGHWTPPGRMCFAD